MTKKASGYLHGFTEEERDRLRRQARQLEQAIYRDVDLWRCRKLLEVGCGVGAQSEVLLRRFPELHVTGVERSEENLKAAREFIAGLAGARDRFEGVHGDAASLPWPAAEFDSAFLCWVLEHVGDPMRVLSEVRRVLRPGSPVIVTEVQNASFFIDPYSPNTLDYWRVFNDHQLELGGDPFVGAKLGNLLLAVGYVDIETRVRTFHLDNRRPGERAEFLHYWTELLLSGAPQLEEAGLIATETVDGMKRELEQVGRDPNAVFYYSFVQAHAVVR